MNDCVCNLIGYAEARKGAIMQSEYEILTHLQENEKTSQRKIAKHTGISLGAVNVLIKKMARKGLVKIEKLNSRTVRYILTPQGLKEKARLTYSFVRSSYNQILKITNAVNLLIEREIKNSGNTRVILYGPTDEVAQILKNTLRGLQIKPEIIHTDLSGYEPQCNKLYLTWRHEDEEKITGKCRVINIMDKI